MRVVRDFCLFYHCFIFYFFILFLITLCTKHGNKNNLKIGRNNCSTFE